MEKKKKRLNETIFFVPSLATRVWGRRFTILKPAWAIYKDSFSKPLEVMLMLMKYLEKFRSQLSLSSTPPADMYRSQPLRDFQISSFLWVHFPGWCWPCSWFSSVSLTGGGFVKGWGDLSAQRWGNKLLDDARVMAVWHFWGSTKEDLSRKAK